MKLAPLFHLALLITAAPLALAQIPIKSGDKVAFLGDSITQQGKSSPSGYVNLVSSALAANGVKIEVIGAGISGHKSDQMLDRLERDVLSKKPQWMTLSCGVNDVWHGEKECRSTTTRRTSPASSIRRKPPASRSSSSPQR